MSPAPLVSVVPKEVNLALYAGDGVNLRLNVSSQGNPLDVSGSVTAQVRSARDASSKQDFAVEMGEASAGIVVLSLSGDQTQALSSGGKFKGVWDVQWQAPESEPRTLIQGSVTCAPDVTRAS